MTNNAKPKKRDFFWITVIVGACFVFLISILIGRFLSSYLVKTMPQTEAIKMPEGSPLPKNYTTLTPYTLLSGTGKTGLTPTATVQTALTPAVKTTPVTPVVKQEVKAETPPEEGTPADDSAVSEEETPSADAAQKSPQGTESVNIDKINTEEKKDAQGNTVYKIQLGAFSTKENAQTLINELKGKGVEATVVPLKKDGKDYFRVQAGAYKNKDSADKLANDLKQQGYPVFVSGQ